MKKQITNLNGQEMRAKGHQTRNRILDATASLMAKVPIRDLSTAEIGRLAKVSKATFYIYFVSVEDAALAVVEALNQSTPKIMEIFAERWTEQTVNANIRNFVDNYMEYWEAHHALLRLRNFAADEGDQRFFQARKKSVEPIHLALQAKIVELQAIGLCPAQTHAPSATSVLLSMLERVSAVVRLPSAHGATVQGQKDSTVMVIACTLAPGTIAKSMTPKPQT